ncbi:hypothetical protein [Flavobacterium sp.]|uniref:hypothetical protein n=1 Tax=Flavobacterium sp. TaxID=239 RepID=UPI0026124F24|nr:hypothetical protein [Flavobacterium sp.]
MKKNYEYLFIKFYKYMLNTPNHENVFNGAIIFLSMIFLFLFFSSILMLKICFGYVGIQGNNLILLTLFFSIIIYYLNFFYFKKNEKYKRLIELYKDESIKQKYIRNFLVIALCLGSFLLLIFVAKIANKS